MANRKEWTLGIFFFLLFLSTRFLYIESDLPPWKLVYYQALDEPYYCLYGYNLYLFGTPTPNLADFIVHNYSGIGNFILQIFPYLSLEFFGNNYIALRTPSVVLSLSVFASVYFMGLKELKKTDAKNRKGAFVLLAFFMIYMLVDFSFLTAGRVLEPTVYRMAAMMAIALYAVKILENRITKKSAFLLGFWGFCSFIFVYLTNFFIVPALFVALFVAVYDKEGWKRAVHCSLFFIAGAALSFILFNLLYFSVFHVDFFTSLMDAIHTYSNRLAVSESSGQGVLKSFLTNIFNFFSTNFFRFNSGVLLVFLLALPVFAKLLLKHKESSALVTGSLLLFLFLQSCVLNDFPYRKLVILVPLVLWVLIYLIAKRGESLEIVFDLKKSLFYRLYAIFSTVFVFLVLYRAIYRDLPSDDHTNLILLTFNAFILIFFFLYFFTRSRPIFTVSLASILLLPHFYLDYRYIYSDPTFQLKEAEQDISAVTGDKYVLGGAAWSLKPYNDYIPLINAYAYLYFATPEIYMQHSLRLKKLFNVEFAIDFLTKKNIEKMDALGFTLYKSYDINEAIGRKIGVFRSSSK